MIHGELEPFLGLGASTLCSCMGALSRATLICRSIAVSDVLLSLCVLFGDGGAFLKLRGRLIQER